jgi:hypothetical protein
MPRGYSTGLKTEVYSVSSDDPALVLLEITHPSLVSPIRVVNDTESIVSNGNTYIALAFQVTLPDEHEGQLPEASISIDNIGREMMQWLDTSNGGRGAMVRFIQVRRSAPNAIEYEISIGLRAIRATTSVVSGVLSFKDFFDKPAVYTRYDPQTAPGLF